MANPRFPCNDHEILETHESHNQIDRQGQQGVGKLSPGEQSPVSPSCRTLTNRVVRSCKGARPRYPVRKSSHRQMGVRRRRSKDSFPIPIVV